VAGRGWPWRGGGGQKVDQRQDRVADRCSGSQTECRGRGGRRRPSPRGFPRAGRSGGAVTQRGAADVALAVNTRRGPAPPRKGRPVTCSTAPSTVVRRPPRVRHRTQTRTERRILASGLRTVGCLQLDLRGPLDQGRAAAQRLYLSSRWAGRDRTADLPLFRAGPIRPGTSADVRLRPLSGVGVPL